MPSRIPEEKRPALRRHASSLSQYLPGNSLEEDLFIINEMRLHAYYHHGGVPAAVAQLSANDAAEVVDAAEPIAASAIRLVHTG